VWNREERKGGGGCCGLKLIRKRVCWVVRRGAGGEREVRECVRDLCAREGSGGKEKDVGGRRKRATRFAHP
jgi:hypothetical protein